MIYYWLLSVFIGGLMLFDYTPTQQFAGKIDANNCQRQANDFLKWVALWQQHEGQRIGSVHDIHFSTLADTHFIWTADTPGLAGCLMVQSAHSRLIVRLHQGQLIDPEGVTVALTLPADIPDGSLIYYYQE
ncbi:type IV pilus biogenesis protein PilM [Tatumella saanichensis]|uniref:type IV pilus biogenesis protein PilM n=1 Tax=Tatumella saanichensis TaxID=480813 RepID=UPI0004ACF535|nr:type IV pilus biogenesis protein PilM [Tatumella saanichensis]